jgi:pimeloyl-ACP methyl ester carboxylesterase
MRKKVQRLRRVFMSIRFMAFGTFIATSLIALRHIIDTPQPLESKLPGEAHLYRWQHGHIFYKTLGDKSKPPLVLLHTPGFGASAFEMRKIIKALAEHYCVYAPDLLGFGLSDRPHVAYSAETYIELCRDFLTQVIGQPAILVASGLSCNYAVTVAQRFPETCNRLVLISPSAILSNTRREALWSNLLAIPAIGFLLYALLSTRPALRFLLSRHCSPHEIISRSDMDYLYATTHQFGAEHAPLALLKGTLSLDASQAFDTLQQPTLIIWGVKALHTANSYDLPDTIEMALIQEAGAYVHEEYPAIVVANIQEWSQAHATKKLKTANTLSHLMDSPDK